MKTSRLAREAASIGKTSELVTRRQTRSFATTLNAFSANGAAAFAAKQEDTDDDSSSLSSLSSAGACDIEDVAGTSSARKRKRGIATPATTVTTVETTTKISPRKSVIKAEDGSPAKIKKGRKQPAKKVVNESGEVAIHPPANWEIIYEAVQEMRKKVLAPVDTMGCESLAEDTRSPRVRSRIL